MGLNYTVGHLALLSLPLSPCNCFHAVCEVTGSDRVQQQQVCVEGAALFKWLGHLLHLIKARGYQGMFWPGCVNCCR